MADLAFKATDSDEPVRDLPLFSIKFATTATSVAVPFGNLHIRIWEPESSVDATLKELSGESTLLGMRKEIQNLSDLGTGDLYTSEELQSKGLDKGLPHYPNKMGHHRQRGWGVTRARIVIKDVARNQDTARNLGISSPTPSADALQVYYWV